MAALSFKSSRFVTGRKPFEKLKTKRAIIKIRQGGTPFCGFRMSDDEYAEGTDAGNDFGHCIGSCLNVRETKL